MTAKEYLQQAYILDRQADLLLEKSDRLRKSLYGHGRSENPTTHQTRDIVEKTIAKIIDYEKKADEVIDRLVDIRIEIENAIATVPDTRQREVLERRYLFYQSWDEIAEKMCYSERQIFRLHRLALQKVVIECQ